MDIGLRDFIFAGLTENLFKFYEKVKSFSTLPTKNCTKSVAPRLVRDIYIGSNAEVLKIPLQLTCEPETRDQNNQTWKDERKLRITASECFILLSNPRIDWSKKVENYYKK